MKNQDLLNGVRSPADIFMSTISAQTESNLALPFALSYSPVSVLNPFQKLLYCGASSSGYAVVPTTKFHNLGSVNWGNRSVIHLHWVASVLKDCKDNDHADFCVLQFEKQMMAWRSRGHKLLWTMHNVLPHDHIFIDAEIALRKAIIRCCDAIHILSKDSAEAADSIYPIPPDKVFHVPHPSYEGWYPNIIDRPTARQYLDIGFEEFTLLTFGSIQRYKGILNLVHAFDMLSKQHVHRPVRLVIAGKPTDLDYVNEINDAIENSPNITIYPTPMEDRDIQILFNAADVVVAPYIKTLNSGIALLAATFKKELVAPYSPGIAETYMNDTTLLYSGELGNQLIDALNRAMEHKISEMEFTKILNLHNPMEISKKFFNAVTHHLFQPTK